MQESRTWHDHHFTQSEKLRNLETPLSHLIVMELPEVHLSPVSTGVHFLRLSSQ